jgi:hypothetical protein
MPEWHSPIMESKFDSILSSSSSYFEIMSRFCVRSSSGEFSSLFRITQSDYHPHHSLVFDISFLWQYLITWSLSLMVRMDIIIIIHLQQCSTPTKEGIFLKEKLNEICYSQLWMALMKMTEIVPSNCVSLTIAYWFFSSISHDEFDLISIIIMYVYI